MFELKEPLPIAFPVCRINLSFQLKEDISLDDFQFFLIRNINNGLSIEDISQICILNSNVIEQSINQLIEQELLEINDTQNIVPSKLSLQILNYKKILQQLSEIEKKLYIDMVSGKINEEETDKIKDTTEYIKANKSINKYDVESLNLADDIDFIKNHFVFLSNYSDEELTEFLNNIMITVKCQSGVKWILKEISSLPEFPNETVQNNDNNICVRLYLRKCVFELHDERFDYHSKEIEALQFLYHNNKEYISSIGEYYLTEYDQFLKDSNIERTYLLNLMSGNYSFKNLDNDIKLNRSTNIDLNCYDFSNEKIIAESKSIFPVQETQYLSLKSNNKIPFDCLIPYESFTDRRDD